MAREKAREIAYRPAGAGERQVTLGGRTPHSRILFCLRRIVYKGGARAVPPHCVSVAESGRRARVCVRSTFPRGADRSSLPSPGRHGSLRAAGPAAASASAAGAAAAAAASAHPRHLQPWREYCVCEGRVFPLPCVASRPLLPFGVGFGGGFITRMVTDGISREKSTWVIRGGRGANILVWPQALRGRRVSEMAGNAISEEITRNSCVLHCSRKLNSRKLGIFPFHGE